ncbi:MAG: DUF2267 domain-containing protein [Sumerlaeia bacterium]
MTTTLPVTTLDETIHKTQIWLKDLTNRTGFRDEEEAFKAIRAVLHSVRDRITINEAAHLGAQLPILLRGVYYEGWRPTDTPKTTRDKEGFLEMVREELHRNAIQIDPEIASSAVFRLLNDHLSEGLQEDVKSMLPKEVRELWEGA